MTFYYFSDIRKVDNLQPKNRGLFHLVGKILGLQAQEGASQVALRDCSEKAGEGVRVYLSL